MNDKLHDDIWEWLDDIGSDDGCFDITGSNHFEILERACDYCNKFKAEFKIDVETTVNEAVEAFWIQLEAWLGYARESLEEVVCEAEGIIEGAGKNEDLQCYLEFTHSDDTEELLELAESDLADAQSQYEKVIKVEKEVSEISPAESIFSLAEENTCITDAPTEE